MLPCTRMSIDLSPSHYLNTTPAPLRYHIDPFTASIRSEEDLIHVIYMATIDILAYALVLLGLAMKPSALNTTCLEGGVSLQLNLYQSICPFAEEIVSSVVQNAVSADPRMAASLLRLHFHDCFVNGCDASVLLDDVGSFTGEKTAPPNLNSLRGFDVIDEIKLQLEQECPGVVSCADILAIAARDSVVLSGGPTWDVEMGRMDSLTASFSGASNSIPGPNSNVANLLSKFRNVGLSPKDMVALSGGHTIGKARCASFRSRLTGTTLRSRSGPGADKAFLDSLQQLCSEGNSTLTHLDFATPATFDNQYYVNLLSGQGLLNSDQALADEGGAVRGLVEKYAADTFAFFDDFKASMVNMGRLTVGAGGEVRRNCRTVN